MYMGAPKITSATSTSAETAASKRPIGQILVDAGVLEPESAARIAAVQDEYGLRFGEAAIKLNLVKRADVANAIAQQFGYTYIDSSTARVASNLATVLRPASDISEQIRSLRTRIVMHRESHPLIPSTVAVVSSSSGDGRTFIAANLAVSFAQLGWRTLLIDGDMRRPRLYRMFGISNRLGLSNLLAGRVGPEAITHFPALHGLAVLTSGSNPPNPQELLTSPRWGEFAAEAANAFDISIIDTPPTENYGDAYLIASRSGRSVAVARRNNTDAKALQCLASGLRAVEANLIGCVFNCA